MEVLSFWAGEGLKWRRRKGEKKSTKPANHELQYQSTNLQNFSTTSDGAGERYGRICAGGKKAAAIGLEVEKKWMQVIGIMRVLFFTIGLPRGGQKY